METETGSEAGQRTAATNPIRSRGLLRSPDFVAVLAILVPGLGHLVLGRLRAAVLWLAAILLGYWAVVLPGAILHAISAVSAYRAALPPAERG